MGRVKQISIHAVEGRGLPTFTRICKSAINWLEYDNSFVWDTDGLLMTDYLHPGNHTFAR